MTTTATTRTRVPEPAPGVLRAGVLASLSLTAALILIALLSGRAAVAGAAVGGVMVLVFFTFGAVVVSMAARVAPATALLVAMVTYTLQVLLVAVASLALVRSGLLDSDLDRGWLAAGVIGATFAWMAGQILSTLRAPIPAWEPRADAASSSAIRTGVSTTEATPQ